MKISKANMDLLKSALDEKNPRGAMVAPYKDGIVFAIPNASMGYFIPREELKVKCKELDRMPFDSRELDIIEESNRLVETNLEQRHGIKTIRQFLFANNMLGEGVWLNAEYLKNFERYTLYQNPAKPKSLILVTEGKATPEGIKATPVGIIMPYNVPKPEETQA